MDRSIPPNLLPSQGTSRNHTDRLYDALTLMSTLRPSSGFRSVLKTDWHRFLDFLAWLCDFRRGGQTVVSIAAERTRTGSRFWIASNSDGNDAERSAAHLRVVLECLEGLHETPTIDPGEVAQKIYVESVAFNRLRVHDYCQKLKSYLASAEVGNSDFDESDIILLSQIKEMLAPERHQQRCNMAYNFQQGDTFEQLSLKAPKDGSHNSWYFIRHYIGRLGSWSRASRFVVTIALRLPHIFKRFQLEKVDKVANIIRASLDGDTTLKGALVRMLPSYDDQLLEGVVQRMQSTSDIDISGTFSEKYKDPNFVPMVHAEVLMMEHFYSNRLDFVDGDRYVGCSKPSCYCCDIYLTLHPGQFEARPCHGNVWVKWCLPFEHVEADGSKQKHAAKMLKKVVNRVVYDLEAHLLYGTHKRRYILDSTTAMSKLSMTA